mmetsp:Transcript_23652/g.60161  ORF Transcript_23652/g.60161 Transcript_23652/m.60161 type:complete len:278 (+) Transcript_23652:50-883(+)
MLEAMPPRPSVRTARDHREHSGACATHRGYRRALGCLVVLVGLHWRSLLIASGLPAIAFSSAASTGRPGRRGGPLALAAGSSSKGVQLVTNTMCPFAQKAWVALEESGLSYETKEISLYGSNGKPAWFMKLSPRGEIPVIALPDGSAVVDSESILDWIAEQAPSMAPSDAAAGAAWRSLLSDRLLPAGKRQVLMGGGKEELDQALADMDAALRGAGTNFAAGDHFSVADAAAVPFVQRLAENYGIPKELTALSAWWARVRARPGVSKTIMKSWWWWW